MGFSPLANMNRRIPDGGRSTPRMYPISGFTIHHNAGVNAYGEASNPAREVSANYWITNEGDILPNIDENRRAWTTGHINYPAGADSDHRNITVEVSNSPEGVRTGSWAISDAAMKALISLIADVFKRHNLGTVKRGTRGGVAVHQDFVPTACPGPYIMGNLRMIVAEAEKIRSGSKPAPTPKPSPAPKPYPGDASQFVGATIELATPWWNYSTAADAKALRNPVRTMPAGKYKVTKVVDGVPHLEKTDKKASGWVHSSVLNGETPPSKPAPKPKNPTTKLETSWWNYKTAADAKALRNPQRLMPAGTYEITTIVDGQPHLRNVNGKHSGWVHSSVLGGPEPVRRKSNAQIAREIVFGVNGVNPWGNDPERSQRLRAAGYDPAAVQREVNKLV